jgi:glycerate kinase
MKILIAPDSFKGSLTAPEAAEAIRLGLSMVWPQARYVLFPLADGGEGTAAALASLTGGKLISQTAQDPLGRPRRASWAILGDGQTAAVEAAEAIGLTLLGKGELDAEKSSSYGFGELISGAIAYGAKRLIVGLGGSATNDGGAGMLAALGARFLDREGKELPPGGLALLNLEGIDISGLSPAFRAMPITLASDVENPLCGPNGASQIFGPQKGASPKEAELLDKALARFAEAAEVSSGRKAAHLPGAGAAGGLGAAFLFFTEAKAKPGAEAVMEIGNFRELAVGASLAVTGEGRTDRQTAWGKAPARLASLCASMGIPTVLLSGSLGPGYQSVLRNGVRAIMSVSPGPMSLEEAMAQAPKLLEEAAARLAGLISLQLKPDPGPESHSGGK